MSANKCTKRLFLILVFFISQSFVSAGCQSSQGATIPLASSTISMPKTSPVTTTLKTSAATAVPTTGVKVSISLASPNVTSGETFTVDVVISSEISLRGAQCALSFDPALMKCDSIAEGNFFKDWATANGSSTAQIPQPSIDNATGNVSDIGVAIMGSTAGGAKGTGIFCTYTFTALAEGMAAPTLCDALLSDENGNVFPAAAGDK